MEGEIKGCGYREGKSLVQLAHSMDATIEWYPRSHACHCWVSKYFVVAKKYAEKSQEIFTIVDAPAARPTSAHGDGIAGISSADGLGEVGAHANTEELHRTHQVDGTQARAGARLPVGTGQSLPGRGLGRGGRACSSAPAARDGEVPGCQTCRLFGPRRIARGTQ